MFSIVLLPEPEGPAIAVNAPFLDLEIDAPERINPG